MSDYLTEFLNNTPINEKEYSRRQEIERRNQQYIIDVGHFFSSKLFNGHWYSVSYLYGEILGNTLQDTFANIVNDLTRSWREHNWLSDEYRIARLDSFGLRITDDESTHWSFTDNGLFKSTSEEWINNLGHRWFLLFKAKNRMPDDPLFDIMFRNDSEAADYVLQNDKTEPTGRRVVQRRIPRSLRRRSRRGF